MENDMHRQVKPRFYKAFAGVLSLLALLGAADIEGRYRNPEYGYLIEIPPGLKGSAAQAPAPQHGFRIGSLGPASSFLWVDGSYNGAGAHSAEEVLEDALKDIRSQAKIESVSKAKTHLGALPAESISIQYQPQNSPDSQEIMTRVEIVALRPGAAPGIVYTLGMIVPASRLRSRQA